MENRLLSYLRRWEETNIGSFSAEQKQAEAAELLIQIGFFQHERLIHLIVTVTFAILTVMAMLLSLMIESAVSFLLPLAFLVLLVPYIRHYYILENGVQKLYTYYDELIKQ